MCIGTPMQIAAIEGDYAICHDQDETHRIDMQLIGPQVIGTWVLVFLECAREVLTEEHALDIRNALTAVQLVMNGEHQIEHLFADLIDREPQLPDFLRP